MEPGKVYLVGAGPGHPDLLTLKAADLLRRADVVVYDRLIQPEILALARPGAERLYMGKPVGKHDARQDEIHGLLVRKAREGKMVVRLKGGDPFLFGRGGEEAEYLAERGVPFEVIPGVSSALAAPLSAGIAVTHREAASCVAIVTGHEAREEEGHLDWSALARLETLVFLMGVRNAGSIAQKLISNGRSGETPAAVIQMAFWHDERVVTGTLATIAEVVEQAGIKPPATLVVGEVVRLRDKLKGAQRDLQRRPDTSSRFEPAPSPDQLIRLAVGGLASEVLRFALELDLFDRLEQPRPSGELAQVLGLDGAALGEILDALVALGMLESRPEGYRNLELASRYLTSQSPHSLKEALLYGAAREGRSTLARFAREGDAGLTTAPDWHAFGRSRECLAVQDAPAVIEKLDPGVTGPVLLLGWGGDAYGEAVHRRWPDVEFVARNPFSAEDGTLDLSPPAPRSGQPFGIVVLSGILTSCVDARASELLLLAVSQLEKGGLLVVHDRLLSPGTTPSPESVLTRLGQHLSQGGLATWSTDRVEETARGLGFETPGSEPIAGGTWLIMARKKNLL
jgi:uroporphyrin-III C-methyltransferase